MSGTAQETGLRRRLARERAADGYRRWEHRTSRPLLVLALLLVVVLVLPLATDLPRTVRTALTVVDVLIWVAFTADYVARLYLSPDRWRFVRTHLLDLAMVLLPVLRPLRAVRLLRIASVLGVVDVRARRTLHGQVTYYVGLAAGVLMVVSAAAMYEVERDSPDANITSFPDGLWWAVTTVTTVGYGDRYPTTTLGRIIAVGLMVMGIALLGVVTASIAAWFVDRLRVAEQAEQHIAHTLRQVLDELAGLRAAHDALLRRLDGVGADASSTGSSTVGTTNRSPPTKQGRAP